MPLGLSQNLFQRVVSALTLLPIVLGSIYLGGWYFYALLALGGVLMLWEWWTLTEAASSNVVRFIAATAVLGSTALVIRSEPQIPGGILLIYLLLLAIFLASFSPAKLARQAEKKNSLINIWLGAVYVALALLSLAWLRGQDGNGLTVIWLFFAVWAMDVGGYFAGKGIGGPKLAPVISPKKTWAGLIGGMILAGIVSVAISLLFAFGDPLLMALAGAFVALIAQAGDLYESALKRALNKKDSGSLIPGHGGILDRVDGLVFAAPVVAFAFVVPELSKIGG